MGARIEDGTKSQFEGSCLGSKIENSLHFLKGSQTTRTSTTTHRRPGLYLRSRTKPGEIQRKPRQVLSNHSRSTNSTRAGMSSIDQLNFGSDTTQTGSCIENVLKGPVIS